MVAKRLGRHQLFAAVVGALLFASCAGAESAFEAGLVDDQCNGNFPACNTTVGCILDNSRYTSGTFPNSNSFLVTLTGPSNVEVDFFLINPTSAGMQTQITWNDVGCTSTLQDTIMGTTFLGTAEASGGVFSATEQLASPGDHLITFTSDATAQYLVKVVITPVNCTTNGC